MKDIAQRAGVSESAVSFALNDRPGSLQITRDRVRRVAEQLGWRPSTAARQLSGQGAATVGLVVARPADTLGVDSFFLQLISGIQEVLRSVISACSSRLVEDVADECRSIDAGGPSTAWTASWSSTRGPTIRVRTSWRSWVCPPW